MRDLNDSAELSPNGEPSSSEAIANRSSVRIATGMHTGAQFELSGESVRLGADVNANFVIIDLPCESITFDKDDNGLWCVQCSGEELVIDGYRLPDYDSFALVADAEIVCREFRIQFSAGHNVQSKPTRALASNLLDTSTHVSSQIQLKNPGTQKNWGLFAGGLGAAALVSSVFLGIATTPPLSTAPAAVISPTSTPLSNASAANPRKRDREREQIADFVNALRLPVLVQSMSETTVDLVWTAMDSPSDRAQTTVGKTLFGRQVRWVQASAPIVDSDEQNVRGRGSQKKPSDRGNAKTEETLRSLGLAEIAQIQATGSRGRYLLTRSGHRIFEGSDLRSGARLTLIGTEAMTVVSNGVTLLVPYDVAKSVNKLANVLTVSKVAVNEASSVNSNSTEKIGDKCFKSMTYVSGTSFAKCDQEGDEVSVESRNANELLRANRSLSLKRN